MIVHSTLNGEACKVLRERLLRLEGLLDADVLTLVGPIIDSVEYKVRDALEPLPDRKPKLAIVLHTGGGVVEVAERMVYIIRKFYDEVTFVIPDIAMSAGTVFAMSGDAIMMDYFSALGPIDPQVLRDQKLVPALSYIVQYERFIEKSANGTLTEAEFALLSRFDVAELHQFEMSRDLSVSLLVEWLAKYKFKDWTTTETRGLPVTASDRETRAKDIAEQLMNNSRWGSHSRGIPMKVLQEQLKLRIDDFGADEPLRDAIREYFHFVLDYMRQNELPHFGQSRCYL